MVEPPCSKIGWRSGTCSAGTSKWCRTVCGPISMNACRRPASSRSSGPARRRAARRTRSDDRGRLSARHVVQVIDESQSVPQLQLVFRSVALGSSPHSTTARWETSQRSSPCRVDRRRARVRHGARARNGVTHGRRAAVQPSSVPTQDSSWASGRPRDRCDSPASEGFTILKLAGAAISSGSATGRYRRHHRNADLATRRRAREIRRNAPFARDCSAMSSA